MPRPIHFEIHAADPQRAIAFYSQLFGWTFTQWGTESYWLVGTGDRSEPGIDGGLTLRRGDAPAEMAAVNAFVCTVGVDDLDAMVRWPRCPTRASGTAGSRTRVSGACTTWRCSRRAGPRSRQLRWPEQISGFTTNTRRALPLRMASTPVWIPKVADEQATLRSKPKPLIPRAAWISMAMAG